MSNKQPTSEVPNTARLTLEKQHIFNVIEQEQNSFNDIGHDVWRYAEKGGQELQSCKKIVNFLKHKSFRVQESINNLDTAFKAEFGESELGGKSHPNIGFLCEYGASENCGHCFGHNLVTANCMAAAIGLQRVIRFSKKRLGKVTVIGCPSNKEKTLKKEMLDAGCFNDIDVLLTAYPANFTCLKPIFIASKKIDVTFRGRSTSEGVETWETANPVDAVVLAQQNLAAVRATFNPDWLINGVIPSAGDDPCSQPNKANCMYHMTAPTQLGLTVLEDRLRQCLQGASTASGCSLDEAVDGLPHVPNVNHDKFAEIYRRNAKLNGFTFHNEQRKTMLEPDDISFISHQVPTFKMFYYAGTAALRGTDEFNRYSGSPEAEYMNIVQGKTLAMMAVDIMLDKDCWVR